MGWGALAVAGGAVLANVLGQRETNRTNRDIAQQQTAASDHMAARQMDFQREMSNTAHQRQVADLEAAGLNPILARS